MKALDDFGVYDLKREGGSNDRESCLETPVNTSDDSSGCLYFLDSEESISKDNYILNIAGSFRDSETRIASSLSNQETVVCCVNSSIKRICTLSAHSSTITNTRFAHEKESHLFTSSLDGTVKLWDLRNPSQVAQNFSGGDSFKPITCFDLSCDGRFICAGTEVVGGTAFLLFWDIRSTKLLGGYWESHIEDLTQVKFHPKNKSKMITGSMDGLINIFDIKKSCEDDALMDSLNTELSVEKLGWLQQSDLLYCLTHSGDLQVWELTDSSPSVQFTRQQIANSLNLKYSDNLYTVDVHVDHKGHNFLLAGSNLGSGDCLRVVRFDKSLKLATSLTDNKQIVRSSVYNSQHNVLITGGEKGIISIWKPGSDKISNKTSNNKIKSQSQKNKSQRTKPY